MRNEKIWEVIKLQNMYVWSWNFIKYIENYSKEHKKSFNEVNSHFCIITEKSVEILNAILEILKYSNRSNWNWYYWTQYLLTINAIPFLYGAYKNAIDWFYIQSSINLRWSFESLLRLYFINLNPKNFNRIFWKDAEEQLKDHWRIVKNHPPFNIKDFLEKDLITPEWIEIYKILSYESHSNIISVAYDMAKIEKWDYDIYVNMQWQIDIWYNINILLMILYAFFRYIDDIFIKKTIFDNQEIEEQKDEIFKTKDFLIKILEKSLLKEYKDEVDKIMETILRQ